MRYVLIVEIETPADLTPDQHSAIQERVLTKIQAEVPDVTVISTEVQRRLQS